MKNAENSQMKKREEYGPATAGFIEHLENVPAEEVRKLLSNLKTKAAEKRRVYFSENEDGRTLHLEIPSSASRSNWIFLSALEDGLKKGDLATKYLNISPQHFAMIRNPQNPNKPNVDLIVIAALVNHRPFSLEDVNHVLMEIELPGLFTDTYVEKTNRRNYILARLLNYAQDHECPRERWIHFAREALSYLGMEPLQGLPGSTSQLSMQEEEMLQMWLDEADQKCKKTNYLHQRKEFLERYAKKTGVDMARAVSTLSKASGIYLQTVKDVFNSELPVDGTRGSRETLIYGAIHMGCTLDEANTMLREANYALLYPFRETTQELNEIALLLRNQVARDPQNQKTGN